MGNTVERASVRTVLRLAGVDAPVALYKATGAPDEPKFEQADAKGEPVATRRAAARAGRSGPVDPIADTQAAAPTEEPVPVEELKKGIRKPNGEFVDLTEHLERIDETTRIEGLDVVDFIHTSQVPRERICGSYYLAVGNGDGVTTPGVRLLEVLRRAMAVTRRYAVVRWTKRKGQSLGVLTPWRGGALLVLELAFAEEWREPNDRCFAHLSAETTETEVSRAVELIRARAARRSDLDAIRDRRRAARQELAERALAGELDRYELEPEVPVEGDLAEALAAATPQEA